MLLGALSLGDLSPQRLCLLLQQGHGAQAVVLTDQGRIALGGNHSRVFLAYVIEQLAECLTAKAIHRVAAKQRERTLVLELVPELFEPNGGRMVSVHRQQGDHLAVDPNTPPRAGGLRNQPADNVLKTNGIRRRVDHESGQRLNRISRDIAP